MAPDKHKPRKANWLMIILVVLVALIAFQMQIDRKERQDRIDRLFAEHPDLNTEET